MSGPINSRRAVRVGFTAFLLAVGVAGGWGASRVGTPMPHMLGALFVTALGAGMAGHLYPRGYAFPQTFRLLFIGIIGVAIGARVRPGMVHSGAALLTSLAAVSLFVVLAQLVNYVLFRRVGRLDPATAWFSGSPGGLLEAVSMGEAAGADIRMLTLLQFLRIILVVSLLPIAFSIREGAPVGSAAGLSMGQGAPSAPDLALDLALVLGLAVVGVFLGRRLHLPAGQLTGPLILAALVSWFGLADLLIPGWMMAAAQVVVGVSLGARFHGARAGLLMRAMGLSALSVSAMLAIGVALAVLVHLATGLSLDMLILSYAPGGMTEMGLVAISLAADPALVAAHHLYRVSLTVVFLSLARRIGFLPGSPQQPEPAPDGQD